MTVAIAVQLQESADLSVSLWLQAINALEAIGSGKPCTFVTLCRSPSLEKEEEEREYKETKKENLWGKKYVCHTF